MNTPICDFVRAYTDSNPVRLHMPGHKGTAFLGPENWDLTEIAGADDLYEPQGIIAKSEKNASFLFGSRMTCYGTEGSSQCVRAMLRLAAERSGERNPLILAARNVHKSFIYGAALLDLEVVWLYPAHRDSLCRCEISPEALEKELCAAGRPVAGVFITSPDYLGGVTDVAALAEVCHRFGTILMVDNAHGAYLHYLKTPVHPLDLGADMCCDSAHKTLPVLTGGAYLHLGKNCPPVGDVRQAMALFGSSSPSYLILQSLDLANAYLASSFPEDLAATCAMLEQVRRCLMEKGWEVEKSDPLRITVNARKSGWRGEELGRLLRGGNIECEYADPEFMVLMATPQNRQEDFSRLLNTMGKNERLSLPEEPALPRGEERVLSLREAVLRPHRVVSLEEAVGKICGAPTVACPPAIPIAVSGERIDTQTVTVLRRYGIQSIEIVDM